MGFASVIPNKPRLLALLETTPRHPYIQPWYGGLSFDLTAGTSASPMGYGRTLTPVHRTAIFVTRITYAITSGTLTSLGVGFEILKDGRSYSIQPGNMSLLRDMAGVGGRPFNLPYPIYIQPGAVLTLKANNVQSTSGTVYILLEGISIYTDDAPQEILTLLKEINEEKARFGVLGATVSIAGNTKTALFLGGTADNNFEKDFLVTHLTGMARDTVLASNDKVYIQIARRSSEASMSVDLLDSATLLGTGEYSYEGFPFTIKKGDGLLVMVDNPSANAHSLLLQLQGILYAE